MKRTPRGSSPKSCLTPNECLAWRRRPSKVSTTFHALTDPLSSRPFQNSTIALLSTLHSYKAHNTPLTPMSFEEPRNALPWELVELIIGFLRSDPKSLRQACLASRTWVPICRAHLFRRIVLHWCDDGTRRSNSLLNLLTHTPSIANYIRELSVHEGLISNGSHTTYCFARSSSLPKLLYLLPHLRLFEFRASTLTHWCELSGELMDAVLYAATCPGLIELALGSWNFSFQPQALDAVLAAAAKNVRILTLKDIVTPMVPEAYPRVGIVDVGSIQLPSEELALKSLRISDGATSMVPFCAQWFYMRPGARISCLHLSCATHQESISDLVRVLGTSLEELELNIQSGRFLKFNLNQQIINQPY